MASASEWWVVMSVAILGAPWIAGIAWYLRRLPRDGFIPPSMADAARQRFPLR